MKEILKNIKSGFVVGFTALFTIIVGGLVYASVNNIWTNPNDLQATAGSQLTSEAWNKILSNQNVLSGALNNLKGTISNLPSPETNSIPTGAVMAFNLSSCPSGWSIASFLKDKFIIGAGNNYALGANGGSTSISGTTNGTALTIDQIPSHNHSGMVVSGSKTLWAFSGTIREYPGGNGIGDLSSMAGEGTVMPIYGYNKYGNSINGSVAAIMSSYTIPSSTSSSTTGNTGGGQTHTHTYSTSYIPPYYALIYCVKN